MSAKLLSRTRCQILSTKSKIELLEGRIFFHSVVSGSLVEPNYLYGTMVPWLSQPVTPAPNADLNETVVRPITGGVVSDPIATASSISSASPPGPIESIVSSSGPSAIGESTSTLRSVSVNSFTQISWTSKASAPEGRAEALTADWQGRIYVFGGFGIQNGVDTGPILRSDYYNPSTNIWTRIADLPQRITHAGTTQDGNSAYFVGGYVGTGNKYQQVFGSNKVWRYEFATNSYTALPNLPQALAGGGAELLGRKLHYFGGFNLNRTDTAIHLVLDLDNLAAGWKTSAPMTRATNHMAHVVFNGKIYAIAGQTGTDGGLVTKPYVSIYDPVTNAWTAGRSMPVSVSHVSSSTFVIGSRIIVMGGESAHEHPVRYSYAYTPATDTWTALTLLPAARFSGVASSVGGKIYFTTGGLQATTWMGTPVG